jgi:DNA-binding transcriptional LysR family regulator
MQRLNWDDLRLFLAVARHGRLIVAARALGINHTTVARRISQLEDAAGVRLIDRSPRGIAPTDAGHALVAYAERIEAEIFAANAALGGADAKVSGTVRVATPEAFGTYVVAPNVARLYAAHPDLRLELIPESQAVHLANRDIDVAVMLNRPPRGPAVARRLIGYRVGLYASRAYLDAAGPITEVAQLSDHPFAWYIDEMIDIPELRFLREVSEAARPTFRSTSIAAQQAAVVGGMGLGVLHRFAADRDDRLVRVLENEVEVRRSFWLAFHTDNQQLPRVRAVVDFLDGLIALNRERF